MSGHIRYRHHGDRIVATLDAKKPFRRSDLSPREEMAELAAEIRRWEGYERMTTEETRREFPDLGIASRKHIAELKKRLASFDYVFNDSKAPAPPPLTLAQLNERNAEFWKGRVYGE